MEHLYAKQVGCGHADTTKWEFMTNVRRDTFASHVGHFSRLSYMAGAENKSSARSRISCLEKMIQPCGPVPVKQAEEDLEPVAPKITLINTNIKKAE